nr:unnamed protein product [Spirometra erinaceieuropaei]
MDLFTAAGLIVNTKRAAVMHQPPPNDAYTAPQINLNGAQLQAIGSFVYLGSTIYRQLGTQMIKCHKDHVKELLQTANMAMSTATVQHLATSRSLTLAASRSRRADLKPLNRSQLGVTCVHTKSQLPIRHQQHQPLGYQSSANTTPADWRPLEIDPRAYKSGYHLCLRDAQARLYPVNIGHGFASGHCRLRGQLSVP